MVRVPVATGDDESAICLVDALSTEGRTIESSLLANGFPLPLQQQGSWPAERPGERTVLAVLLGPDGREKSAVGLRLFPSRALPGYFVARVLKFGHGLNSATISALVSAAVAAANAIPKVIRLHLEGFSPDNETRRNVAEAAATEGFRASESVRTYAKTLVVDLSGSEEEVLARFHRMVRKNLRKTERLGHVVAPIADVSLAERLNDLVDQTMSRTGATSTRVDWAARISAAAERPQQYRVAGLFLSGQIDAEHLVSFRWCGMQAGFGDDLVAASARIEGEHASVPLMHSVMWDMLSWARACGASWFDFGGVVSEGDPYFEQLRSISEFKRLFSSEVATVGEDFELDVKPLASRVATLASTLGSWLR